MNYKKGKAFAGIFLAALLGSSLTVAAGEPKTNEELLALQNIQIPEETSMDFRFIHTGKTVGIILKEDGSSIFEEMDDASEKVGEASYMDLVYILAEPDTDWAYIESGEARGFIRQEDLLRGSAAERIVSVRGEDELGQARALTEWYENAAFTYTHTTTLETPVEEEAYSTEMICDIYEECSEESRVIGSLPANGICYLLSEAEEGWLFVESGDVRGFVKSEKLREEETGTSVSEEALASEEVKPEDNRACYYTLTSVKEADEKTQIREELVSYALEYEDTPYVWGGTSLTTGADSAGFLQSLFAEFDYDLPRTIAEQSVYGTQIAPEYALPGDLICYGRNGYIYQIVLCIGNDRVLAMTQSYGAVISDTGDNALWAVRVIE